MSEELETFTPADPPSQPDVRPRFPLWPLPVILLGMAMLAGVGVIEQSTVADQPWRSSMVVLSEDAPGEAAIPAKVRPIDRTNLPPSPAWDLLRNNPDTHNALAELGLDEPKREHVVSLSLPIESWREVLASGRMPQSGKPEVLAGDLVRFDSFKLGSEEFHVVGRIRPDIPAFTFRYLLPADAAFESLFTGEEVKSGWLLQEGLPRDASRMIAAAKEGRAIEIMGGYARVPALWTLAAIVGLIVVTMGGMFFIVGLLQWWEPRSPKYLRPVLTELRLRPRLVWGLHAGGYSAWFLFMTVALAFPRANYFLVVSLSRLFASGELEHVGAAYASESVLKAAYATFYQNFVTATVVGAILFSLVIPFWGVFKNLLSFSILGFAMAPLWANSAMRYTYHSITIVVELEAYILAAFLVCVWPLRWVRGITDSALGHHVLQGAKVILSGTAVIAIILALAALYEASTLILLQ